jgi:hypothetical protein
VLDGLGRPVQAAPGHEARLEQIRRARGALGLASGLGEGRGLLVVLPEAPQDLGVGSQDLGRARSGGSRVGVQRRGGVEIRDAVLGDPRRALEQDTRPVAGGRGGLADERALHAAPGLLALERLPGRHRRSLGRWRRPPWLRRGLGRRLWLRRRGRDRDGRHGHPCRCGLRRAHEGGLDADLGVEVVAEHLAGRLFARRVIELVGREHGGDRVLDVLGRRRLQRELRELDLDRGLLRGGDVRDGLTGVEGDPWVAALRGYRLGLRLVEQRRAWRERRHRREDERRRAGELLVGLVPPLGRRLLQRRRRAGLPLERRGRRGRDREALAGRAPVVLLVFEPVEVAVAEEVGRCVLLFAFLLRHGRSTRRYRIPSMPSPFPAALRPVTGNAGGPGRPAVSRTCQSPRGRVANKSLMSSSVKWKPPPM